MGRRSTSRGSPRRRLGNKCQLVTRYGVDQGRQVKLPRGSVVLVGLDPAVGHEQRGQRPCLAVSDPTISEDARFPMVCVIPLTGTPGEGALYPALQPGRSGLRKESFALVDQLRSIDKRRVHRVFGRIGGQELEAVDAALALFVGLQAE